MGGQRRRSEASRDRIAEAARRLFAEMGYERTTIRAVATAAGIDPAMVIRYFGSKEGLFAAVTVFDLRLPDVAALPRDGLGAALVRHFLARWEDEADSSLAILLRAATSNPDARARMRATFAAQVLPMVRRLAPDHREAGWRAELLATQILGLAFCRYVLGLPTLAGATADAIAADIGPALQRYLVGPDICPAHLTAAGGGTDPG